MGDEEKRISRYEGKKKGRVRGDRPLKRKAGKMLLEERVRRVVREAEKGMGGIPGWEEFTNKEKIFLMVLPFTGWNAKAAAEMLGYEPVYSRRPDRHPLFHVVIEERMDWRERMVAKWYADVIGEAFIVLHQVMWAANSDALRLKAAESLLDRLPEMLGGMAVPVEEVTVGKGLLEINQLEAFGRRLGGDGKVEVAAVLNEVVEAIDHWGVEIFSDDSQNNE